MAEVRNELMYELMKEFHQRFDKVDFKLSELKSEFQSMRGTLISVQHDIHNIYGILGSHDVRLDRIERRLELREVAEQTRPYDPHS